MHLYPPIAELMSVHLIVWIIMESSDHPLFTDCNYRLPDVTLTRKGIIRVCNIRRDTGKTEKEREKDRISRNERQRCNRRSVRRKKRNE